LHDPQNPNGLGPSSSANGLDFVPLDLRGILPDKVNGSREYAVVSRWTDFIAETTPGTDDLEYRDIVIVDPATGAVIPAIRGFVNPIDVLRDPSGGFLIADWGNGAGSIYHASIRPLVRPHFTHDPVSTTGVPEPGWPIGVFWLAGALSRRR
jgi:hypothetical protein